jgi:glycosyltransferase involved in cell wall biosynthesis
MSLKIAIYAICKNESKHVDRWMNAILPELQEQDSVIIFDTGSTDNSVELFKKYDDRVIIRTDYIFENGFRFDLARNTALNDVALDVDVCIKLDLDEVISPGWRDAIERAWTKDLTPQRLSVRFIWNHHEDGNDDKVFNHNDMVHSRHGYRWTNACHEVLSPYTQDNVFASDVVIHHWADNSKPRSSYLDLLAIDVQEQPENPRACLYYARELFFKSQYDKATQEFKRFLSMPNTWNVERCYAYRLMSQTTQDKQEKISLLHHAVAEAPNEREGWIELAEAYGETHIGKMFASSMALNITQRPTHYLSDSRCWTLLPYDLNSVGAWYAGAKQCAYWSAQKAFHLSKNDERLKNNLIQMQNGLCDPYSTHQRMLSAAVAYFGGPVLETGCGHYSTPLLHGLCSGMNIKLSTFDSDFEWQKLFLYLQNSQHIFVSNENKIPEQFWGVVFIDGKVDERLRMIKKYLPLAKAIVMHDIEDKAYGYDEILTQVPFKIFDDSKNPQTAIVSMNDLKDFHY